MNTPMTPNQWISVKERLPENRRLVLVCAGKIQNVFPATLKEGVFFTEHGECCPTHWMPLPEPPPKPDAFEEWWRETTGTDSDYAKLPGMLSATIKQHARAIWNAAIASTKDSR